MYYAYVWLLFKNESYLSGLLTSMYSVKKTTTVNDLVVMLTPDVAHLKTNPMLAKLANKIIIVDYLTFKRKSLAHPLLELAYAENSDVLNTKWQVLSLIDYDKVLLLDCDTVVYENIDELFTLPTPAAPFSTSFAEPLGTIPFYYSNEKGPDNYLLHGDKILFPDIKMSMSMLGTVMTASSVLISPSLADHKEFISTMTAMEPFGFPSCQSGICEQAIIYYYYYVKKQPFYNIHHRYNYYSHNPAFLEEKDKPLVLHIISKPKPWQKLEDLSDNIKKLHTCTIDLDHDQHDKKEWEKINAALHADQLCVDT